MHAVLFYPYENVRANGHQCHIHRGSCRWCNHGTGLSRQGTRRDNGTWHPGVPMFPQALAIAQATGATTVRLCGHCRPDL